MRIDAGSLSFAYQQMMQGNALASTINATATHARTNNTTTVTPAGATPKTSAATVNFTNMTRQEMVDWTQAQIGQGRMTLDESSPLLAINAVGSTSDGQAAGQGTETSSINYVERVQEEIENARQANNQTKLNLLLTAASVMRLYQSEHHGINAVA